MAPMLSVQVASNTKIHNIFNRFSDLTTFTITTNTSTTLRKSMKLLPALPGSKAKGIERAPVNNSNRTRLTSLGRAVILPSTPSWVGRKISNVAIATQKALDESQNKDGKYS